MECQTATSQSVNLIKTFKIDSLEDAFKKTLFGLDIRETKKSGLTSCFGLLDKPPYVRVRGGKEIELCNARGLFYNAYGAIISGMYRDDCAVEFESETDKYFFDEGVKFARRIQLGYERSGNI